MAFAPRLATLGARGLLSVAAGAEERIVPWPAGLLPFDDDEGVAACEHVDAVFSGGDWEAVFHKQVGRRACGVASSLGLLNQNVPPRARVGRDADNTTGADLHANADTAPLVSEATAVRLLFGDGTDGSACHAAAVAAGVSALGESFVKGGLTMEQLSDVLACLVGGDVVAVANHRVRAALGGSTGGQPTPRRDIATTAEFVEVLRTQIAAYGGCIVNYSMTALGQTGGCGHFSLAVGVADAGGGAGPHVALLDPWPDTPCCLVPAASLLHAMRTTDDTTQKLRGLLELPVSDTI